MPRRKKGENNKNSLPDYSIKPVEDKKNEEKPEIFKVKKLAAGNEQTRRDFIKNITGIIGVAGLSGILANCDTSKINLTTDANGNCTCHVVCTCDSENEEQETETESITEEQWDGETCTCNTVCTCDTVCTCNTVGTGGGGSSCSSCGGGYWYPN